MDVVIGDVVLWISDKGYSYPAGQRAEVYAVNVSTRRAAINTVVEGDEVSYSVSFDELGPYTGDIAS